MIGSMLRISAILLLFGLLGGALPAASIDEAHTRFMREGQFQLLREFFTGKESTGNRFIARTDPAVRSGQYFSIKLDSRLESLPGDAEIVLEVISTEDIEPVRHVFPLDVSDKPRSRRILLGLTGADWPNEDRKALAWKIELRSGETLLDEWKSFLWEMP